MTSVPAIDRTADVEPLDATVVPRRSRPRRAPSLPAPVIPARLPEREAADPLDDTVRPRRAREASPGFSDLLLYLFLASLI